MVLAENGEGARTRLFNADGSYSELSGNGVRCAAGWIADSRKHKIQRTTVIGTDAGSKELTLLERAGKRYTFRAAMGAGRGSARGTARGERADGDGRGHARR